MNQPVDETQRNAGIRISGTLPIAEQKTFVVLGAGRGGTSVCAGVLHHLGVFLGDNCRSPIFEDAILSRAVEERSKTRVAEIVASYNAKRPIWGFKRPSIISYIDELHPLLRNPIYIAVFRDPVAVANRHSRIADTSEIRRTLVHYEAILSFVDTVKPPCIFASYEKILSHKQSFVSTLAEAIGTGNVGHAQFASALDFITAEPPEYLAASKEHPEYLGHLDTCSPAAVKGWACARSHRKPVTVDILLNEDVQATVCADEARPDVRASGLHTSDYCGFTWTIPEDTTVRAGDVIAARIHGTQIELNGSPQKIATP